MNKKQKLYIYYTLIAIKDYIFYMEKLNACFILHIFFQELECGDTCLAKFILFKFTTFKNNIDKLNNNQKQYIC